MNNWSIGLGNSHIIRHAEDFQVDIMLILLGIFPAGFSETIEEGCRKKKCRANLIDCKEPVQIEGTSAKKVLQLETSQEPPPSKMQNSIHKTFKS